MHLRSSMRTRFEPRYLLLFISVLFFGHYSAQSQCVTTYPYHEDFEGGPGSWITGGANSDWALGAPSKAVINSAASGNNCWITGGLTASFYNFSEKSWVQSPCFNFSGLAHPYVHFKIWWESEYKFDGTNFQYSLDNGTTWTNVGAVNEPTNCWTANWYNYNPVNFLTGLATVRDGWCGNIQATMGSCQGGNGSNGWVEAKHCMPTLAGKTNVLFRFTFGSGTTCNNFDGVAFDDIYIEEAPPIMPDFIYTCTGGTKTYGFTDQSSNCPGNWSWNFGDPSSGASNTSTQTNPTHTFSGPGVYTVTMTVSSACAGSSVITHTVQVNSVTAVGTPVGCHGGNDGTATATVTPANGNQTLTWSTSPPQTGNTVTDLVPGTYTVTVTEPNICPVTTTVTITQPPSLTHTISSMAAACGQSTGTATIVESGGTQPYAYEWTDGSATATASNLPPGPISVTVTDAHGCTDVASVNVANSPPPTAVVSSHTNVSCGGGSNGTATVTASGGTQPYTYDWSPSGGSNATATGLSAGFYVVTVTDAHDCTAIASVNITEPPPMQHSTSSVPASCGGTNGSATIQESGGVQPYTYVWSPPSGNSPTASNLGVGTYNVTVTDSHGCTDEASIDVGTTTGVQAAILSSTNVSCFGGNNGKATAIGTGGPLPLSYSWSPSGGNGATANGLTAGTYTVTVTDAGNCTDVATVVITQPNALTHNTSATPTTCNSNNGTASILENGGTTPYQYIWTPAGGSAANAANLAPGNYVVSVTDAHACKDTAHITIGNIPTVQAVMTSVSPVSCFGGADGSATVTASSGTPAYSYAWSPSGGNNATADGLAAGTYKVTVTDANLCTATATAIITQPTALHHTTTSTNPPCGAPSGTASVTETGGTGPYTYSWSPSGGNGSSATNLSPGNYIVSVEDAHNCVDTAHITIVGTPVPTAVIFSSTDVSCFGGANGKATVIASGGFPPYTYAWLPGGGAGATITGLVAGDYTVTVTDAHGCTATAVATINQPAALQHTVAATGISCGSNNGTATITETGGTSPYTYTWSPAGGPGNSDIHLAAGNYVVTVTDTHACTDTVHFSIQSVPPPQVTITGVNPVGCFGGSTGSATATVMFGAAPFTYTWSPTGGTGATASGLSAGTYQVTVTDAAMCTATASATITQPPVLQHTAASTPANCGTPAGTATVVESGGTGPYTYAWSPTGGTGSSATNLVAGNYIISVTDQHNCLDTVQITVGGSPAVTAAIGTSGDASCNGLHDGSVSVNAGGGVGPYSYSWSPAGGSGANATGLGAGTYIVTVTDSKLCTATASATIAEPSAFQHTTAATASACGTNNGTATVVETGGTSPYTYAWSPTGGSAATATALAGGSYIVSVTDAHGCVDTAHIFVNSFGGVQLALPTTTPVNCNGDKNGSIAVSATGGVLPYIYTWSDATITGTGGSGLAAGTYTVTVTDANLCATVTSGVIAQPPALQHAPVVVATTCGYNNGSVTINETGGTGPYTYTWSLPWLYGAGAINLAPGNYTVTITDQHNCTDSVQFTIAASTAIQLTMAVLHVSCPNGADGSATVTPSGGTGPYTYNWSTLNGAGPSATNLHWGFYTVTVTDANHCTATASATITVPPSFTYFLTGTPATCGLFNGSGSMDVTGGTQPYTYHWLPSGGNSPTASNLAPGIYVVSVSDYHGCDVTATLTVIATPTVHVAPASIIDVLCFGDANGSVTVDATIGPAPFSYNWSTPNGAGPTATALAPGTYTVTVTDANQCTAKATATVGQPAILHHTGTSTAASCKNDGTAAVVETGGTGPYSYQWTPSGGTAATASNLSPGMYIVSITDQHNCLDTAHVVVGTLPAVAAQINITANVNCSGGSTGSAKATAAGGAPPYQYAWSPTGGNGPVASGLPAGTYTVTITDAHQCTATATVTITQLAALQHNLTAVKTTCGKPNGSATVQETGGTQPYTYTWSPAGGTGSTASSLGAGNYTVSIVDQHGCIDTAHVSIGSIPSVQASLGATTNVSCFGGNNGTAAISASTGAMPYNYAWSATGASGPNAGNLAAGTYTVTVTDAHQCTATVSLSITQPAALHHIGSTTAASCKGNDGTAKVVETGGTAPYQYNWSPAGGTGPAATGLAPGNYLISITDGNLCVDTVHLTVKSTELVHAVITAVTSLTCFNDTDGTATAKASGGTPPYTYAWSPTGGNSAVAQDLGPGHYTIQVTDAAGCVGKADTVLLAPPPISLRSHSIPVRCFGQANGSILLDTVFGGTPSYQYALGTGAFGANILFTPLKPGLYTIRVKDAHGCIQTDSLKVTQPAPLTVNAGEDTTIYQGSLIDLAAIASDPGRIVHYQWKPALTLDCDTCVTTTALPPGSTVYTIYATDSSGCVAFDSKRVQVLPTPIYVPNVFTPGKSGKNDHFTLYAGDGVEEIEFMRIYDRWGDLVFENLHFVPNIEHFGWDGYEKKQDAPVAVYVYVIVVRFKDGTTTVLKGDVTVVR